MTTGRATDCAMNKYGVYGTHGIKSRNVNEGEAMIDDWMGNGLCNGASGAIELVYIKPEAKKGSKISG